DVPIAELPFKQLGDFELLRELGRGGMGVVYEAMQTSIGRHVALKLLSLSSALNPKQIARFHNEARAAGLLQHANIVPVYSVGTQQGIHYYAMQLIEGTSIDQWIEQQRQLEPSKRTEWQKIVEWIAQIGNALHAAHEAGIIHRDIKPSNLLLDTSNRIWVTDFGLARCTQSSSVTATGDMVGTVRYMSPEQASGRSSLVDGGADMYGLAASLYEMLTLQPAIEGDDPTTILKRIADCAIRPIRSLRPDLPRDLAVVINKAMSYQRYHRYETAQDFAEDLRRVLDNKPPIARPVTAFERVIRWSLRHQRTASSVAAVLVVFVLGLIASYSLNAAQKRKTEAFAELNAKNERMARTAFETFGFKVAEILENIPSAEIERRQILEEALRYHQQFAAIAQNSPDTRRSFASTLGVIGSLHGELGASEDSVTALRESQTVFAELAKLQPRNADILLDWSVSMNNLGQALHRHGKLSEAVSLIQHALEVQERLATMNDSDDLKRQSSLAWANLGLLKNDMADIVNAESAYRRSIALLTDLDQTYPDSSYAVQLAKVESDLAALLAKTRSGESIELAKKALSRELSKLEKDPSQAKLSKQTGSTLNSLGSALYEDKRYQSALEYYQQAEDIYQQLVNRWPEQPDYRSDLAASLNQIGLTLIRLNRMNDAKVAFEKALEHQNALASKFGRDPEVLSTTGRLLYNYGFLCEHLGLKEKAQSAFRDCSQYENLAVQLAPEVRRYRDLLESHKSKLQTAKSDK
ncbi:MAG: protein kinase, partial [Pirellulales bacterium]